MTAMNKEVYRAFKTVGAPEDEALAAAESVPAQSDVVTKADLQAALSDLEARFYRALWIQGAAVITIIAGLFSIIAGSG